jgi:hypothetical protein
MKTKTIETPDYILAVSDGVKAGDYVVTYPDKDIVQVNQSTCVLYDEKIIAHQPKGNAPSLDLPLLPEIVVEDEVEKLSEIYAEENAIDNNISYHNLYSPLQYAFKAGYKSATKVYSEEDLRKAIHFGKFGEYEGIETTQKFIQSLNQTKN